MPYLFIVFILIAQCLLFLVHFAVYELVLVSFLITSTNAIFFLRLGFVVASLSFIVASLVAYKNYNLFTQAVYTTAVVWLGFLFYLLLASLIYFIFSALFPSFGFLPELGKILMTFAFLASIFGILNANNLKVIGVTSQLVVPETWTDRKIVFISDIHVGQVIGKKFIEKMVGAINEISPDLVLIGGDFFDGTGVDIDSVTAPLKNIKSVFGTYFISGNHEEFETTTKYFDAITSQGIKFLNNEFIDINGLQLVGVDYKSTVGTDNFRKVLTAINYDRNKPTILLKHTPLNLDVAHDLNINFQLSGHTHRAQMFPLNLITALVYKGYDYGFKKYKDMEVYTSSGVGTWGPPLKVGSPSEIVVITF